MSPALALHDPIFRSFVFIIGALLALGGGLLALLEFGFRKNLGAIWNTYFSWLVIAPVGLAIVFAGRVPTILGVMLLGCFAFGEFARASQLHRDRPMCIAVLTGIVLMSATNIFRGRDSQPILFASLVAILLLPIFRNRPDGETRKLGLALIAFVYLGWMFQQLGALTNFRNAYGYFLFVTFSTEVCDIAAFSCGRIFGRHPLRSRISPKKTWEGAAGALLLAMILPWALAFALPDFGARQRLFAGLIIGIGGQLGDLSISMFKREFGTKDMGSFIPGHGGILDRIDSLLYVAPLFLQMAKQSQIPL